MLVHITISHPSLYSNFAPPKHTPADQIGITKRNAPYSQSNILLHTHHHTPKACPYTGGRQSTENTQKLRNRICMCWLLWKNFSWQHWMFFFSVFTLCYAHVSALVIGWVTVHAKEYENRGLVQFWKRPDRWCLFSWSISDKTWYIIRSIESESL
jgi:hypothetical protein